MGYSMDNEEIQLSAGLQRAIELLWDLHFVLNLQKEKDEYVIKELKKIMDEVGSCLELSLERFSVRL